MKRTKTGRGFVLRRSAAALLGGALLVLAAGCSDSNPSPTAPGSADLVLASASVLVNGQVVGGRSLPRGHGDGASTRFEAQLTADGAAAPGQTMWLEFERPRGTGMGHHTGRIPLYDDGTHGDRVAGDGLYCFEDFVGDYGCHSDDAEPGEYHFEFYGVDHDGHETNHMTVSVTITNS